jgi:hypothetical protein
MCNSREINGLIEIRFSKDLWTIRAVARMQNIMMLGGMLVDDDVYSQWYKIMYHDIRLFKNIRAVPDVKNRLIMIYGDER